MVYGNYYRYALTKSRRALNAVGLRRKKVFAIGFNKCGTTSLHSLFSNLGLPSYHGEDWRECTNFKLLDAFDCFSDGIPADLAVLDSRYSNAKFILQLRDARSWVYSRLGHIAREKKRDEFRGHLEWDETSGAVEAWIRKRNDYHLYVLDYFKNRPEDLLLVNFISDSSAATKVANFLGYSGNFDRPNENVRPNKSYAQKHIDLVSSAVDKLAIEDRELDYDIYCPSLETPERRALFASDSTMLVSSSSQMANG